MRRVDWLMVAIIGAFLASAALAQLMTTDDRGGASDGTVKPVAHFISWPATPRQVDNLSAAPARHT